MQSIAYIFNKTAEMQGITTYFYILKVCKS